MSTPIGTKSVVDKADTAAVEEEATTEETNEKSTDSAAATTDAAVAQKEGSDAQKDEGSDAPKDDSAPDPTDVNNELISPTAAHKVVTKLQPAVPGRHEPRAQYSETIFPRKLYDILCNPEFSHAISWMPHGRSWKVLNKEYFMAEICPQYFSQSRFESFIRQVNGWGFRRIRKEGPDRSSYYHESFLRGFPHLIEQLRRPTPGEKARDTREEPDFNAVAPLPQLTRGPMMKVGKTAGGLNGMGPIRSSFDAVPPKDHPSYPPFMGAPWGPGPPPPYFSFAPHPHQYPPLGAPSPSSPYRGGPPPPHPHGFSYPPPSGWGIPPPGPNLNSNEQQEFNHPPIGYPYPPPYDPHFYSYPPHPATPQHGRPQGDSAAQTPKRDREETANNGQSEHSPKRPPVMQQHHAMPPHGPPPPMGYYYPPMYGVMMTPRKEADKALETPGPTVSDEVDPSK
jgi:hypothetical protein